MNKYKEIRPWGSFTILDEGSMFKVKKISVNPSQKLSLQYHNHRSEHWTIVSGQASVTKGKDIIELNINDSIYIPLGEVHSLENKKNCLMELIEVQIGDYLGEDDIVRLDDKYGRI